MQAKTHVNDFLLPALGARLLQHVGFAKHSYSLVCLNSPSLPLRLLPRLWAHCHLKVCADGGANRVFHGLSLEDRKACVPNFIVGDLDSLEKSVEKYYHSLGASIVGYPDQETNDLDKSLMFLKTELAKTPDSPSSSHSVLILGAFGGRFDQEMANLHALYVWKDAFHRLILVDSESTAELLDSQQLHRIVPMSSSGSAYLCADIQEKVEEGRYCGLLPVSQPVQAVTTTGLQWDLHGEPLAFGQRISTSNSIPNYREVTVLTSEPLLWTSSYDITTA